jgi:nucleotide-binding universal stress UspA family protein
VNLAIGKVSSIVIQGYPAKVPLEAASGADLLVVGNRGHSEFTELLGSVSQHVVTHATCPVLVMR